MSPFSRNSLIVVCLLVASIAIILKIQADSTQVLENSVNLEVIPHKIGFWDGVDIPMSQDVYDILETDDVVFREYRDESNYPVVVAIIFSDSKRASFHPPEICYIGGGSELMEKKFEKLIFNDGSTLNTTKLAIKSDANFVTAWYWFMIGEKKIASYYWQQLSMLKNLFIKKPIQGAMIRISVDGNDALGKEKASKFAASLMPYLDNIHHSESLK